MNCCLTLIYSNSKRVVGLFHITYYVLNPIQSMAAGKIWVWCHWKSCSWDSGIVIMVMHRRQKEKHQQVRYHVDQYILMIAIHRDHRILSHREDCYGGLDIVTMSTKWKRIKRQWHSCHEGQGIVTMTIQRSCKESVQRYYCSRRIKLWRFENFRSNQVRFHLNPPPT